MMRYWCVNCGEPGICTHKTTICGACGWDAIREYDKEDWDETCQQRSCKPRPHPPRSKVNRVEARQVNQPLTGIAAALAEAEGSLNGD